MYIGIFIQIFYEELINEFANLYKDELKKYLQAEGV